MRSFLVCFSYDFKAAPKMAWKREEAVDVEAVWDMGAVKESKIILWVRVGTISADSLHGLVVNPQQTRQRWTADRRADKRTIGLLRSLSSPPFMAL
jgi:hypothetical protein